MRIVMRAPDGNDCPPMTAVFQELVEPERIVFLSKVLDANGKSIFEVLNTVTLTAQAGKTTLTLHAKVTKAALDAPKIPGRHEPRLDRNPRAPGGARCQPVIVAIGRANLGRL